jgi:anti-anti-sigma factor
VTGDLDRELRRVEATDAPRIVLDLDGLQFMDASGAGLLRDVSSRSRLDGARLRLRGALSQQVRRLLELTGIGEMLPFEAGS